jgi:signal peptidase I
MHVQLGEKVFVALDDKIAKEYNLSSKIKIDPKGLANQSVKDEYNENWNLDNFGPLKIPYGKCFFIGDNRHNSADSRVNGLINEKDIVGKVVFKK